MSNHFPAVPTDFVLASVEYDITFPPPTQVTPDLIFAGVITIPSGASILSSGNALMIFQFTTPGSFGTFDQDAAETAIKIQLTDICQFMANSTGATLAQVQEAVKLIRHWAWTDAAGNMAAFTDTVTYP